MTTKTIKTILFAGLITAMILPFSGMDFAQAKQADDRLEKLAELKAQILSDKEVFAKEKHYDADLAIQRIELAEKFVSLDIQGKGNSEAAQVIISELLETQSGIEYPNVIRDEDPIFGQTFTTSHYTFDTYTTNSVSRFNCSTQSTNYGSASGSITGYHNSAYLVGTLSYPSAISSGTVGNCTNTNWSDSDMTYVLLDNPFVGCAQPYFTSSTDSEGGTCNYLKAGQIVVVTVAKSKYGTTNFSSTNPISIVTL